MVVEPRTRRRRERSASAASGPTIGCSRSPLRKAGEIPCCLFGGVHLRVAVDSVTHRRQIAALRHTAAALALSFHSSIAHAVCLRAVFSFCCRCLLAVAGPRAGSVASVRSSRLQRWAAALTALALSTALVSACSGAGASGQPTASRTAANGDVFNTADVEFASAMIPLHAQALQLVTLLKGGMSARTSSGSPSPSGTRWRRRWS